MAQAAVRTDLGGENSQPRIKTGAKSSREKLSQSSGEKVTIGCKLPSGFVLQLYGPMTVKVPFPGGGYRDETMYVPIPDEVIRLNGSRTLWGEQPGHEVKHGAGLTFNVPKDFWDEWCRQFDDSPLLLNGVLTVERDRKSLVDLLKDEKERRSGLEPLIPDTDPRIPRNRFGKPAVVSKTTDDE